MSLDGIDDVPALPGNAAPAGVDLGTAIVLPPGGQVFYVRGNGTTTTNFSFDPPGLPDRLIASIAKAATYTVANRGDTIVVLPGHTENVSTADYFSALTAGTKILGLGTGNNRPTLTWTAAGSSWLMSKANVTVDNMRLLLAPAAGTVTVTAPITVSAVGNTIRRCYIEVSNAATRLSTTSITVAAGADDFQLTSNIIWGATTGTPTDCIAITGAVARTRIISNNVQVATSSGTHGVLVYSAAATDGLIQENFLWNKLAASTVVIQGFAAASALVTTNKLATVGGTATAVCVTTIGNLMLENNTVVQPGTRAIPITTGSAAT